MEEETKARIEKTKAERAIEAHISTLHEQRIDKRSYTPK